MRGRDEGEVDASAETSEPSTNGEQPSVGHAPEVVRHLAMLISTRR
jgi:hypothetical protein